MQMENIKPQKIKKIINYNGISLTKVDTTKNIKKEAK